MAGNAISQQASHRPITLDRQHGTTAGVIDTDQVAIDEALELVGVLAKVMQQAGNLRQLLPTKGHGAFGRQLSDRLQMLR